MNLICLAYSIVKLIVHVLGLICVDGKYDLHVCVKCWIC